MTDTQTLEAKPQTKEEKKQSVRDRLDELTRDSLDLDASYYLNDDDLDGDIDDVMEKLQEAVNENADIIYYSRAIEFLSENDPSLTQSLELASEFWYSLEDLNSEKLASLLNYEQMTEELGKIRGDIDDLMDERHEIQEEENENDEND